ncbi:MAG: type II toxin-antitoxin system death-on-curing family toxin [Chloroflexota bacterium]|nr:type II toxin-antitoxin system death-on-curing family toxin [Chloroflexota bacterium]
MWLTRLAVDLLHYDQLTDHGGRAGLRDENELESVLARPRNQWHYEGITELDALAASLGYGLARRHPYVDGNKRIAFVSMAVFLDINGRDLVADESAVVEMMLAIAAGSASESDLAIWIRTQSEPR